MSHRTSSSLSSVSSAEDPVIYIFPDFDDYSSLLDMSHGTPNTKKGGTGVTRHTQTLQTSELNKTSWAKEIEGKVSVFNEPVERFLDVFVPGPGASRRRHDAKIKNAFKDVPLTGLETEKYPDLMRGLKRIVERITSDSRPAFSDGSHCKVPFSFEAWGKEQHYTMPDIAMSLPGPSGDQWASTWQGISTVFEVKRDGAEDPVEESSATIRTGKLPTGALIQVSKSARNLLHTHRLLYAYVVGIYNHKARIYRFDHAAGVVSRAIDLKKDPFPLFDFLWRFCRYEQPTLSPPHVLPSADTTARPHTRSIAKAPRRVSFLGMDPSITIASEVDCNKVDALLQECSPPQAPLTKEERDSCRWVAIVTEYNLDGSAKTTKWYILYRLRFLNPRLFSRATTVRDAYDGETWEQRAIKDAWRQLARDREDVLYSHLREGLLKRDDLEQLVEECKRFGLPCGDESASDAGSDTRSETPPPSTVADHESEHELNDNGTPVLADELEALSDILLYGLPDVETGVDLGAREARKLWVNQLEDGGSPEPPSQPSDADLDSLAQGDESHPPSYDIHHRTICAWLRDHTGKSARFNERSHMRLVMKTVGRPLSSFKSTKEMVTAIRDAIIGHMLAFKAGLVHRDLSDGNVMIKDGGLFSGFLLDFDYAFNWKEALEEAGWPSNEAAWTEYVREYNSKLPTRKRPALPGVVVPLLVPKPGNNTYNPSTATTWKERMRMKERTGTLFFMAIQVLRTYLAHDVCHDLESAIWLLLCVVLRHTSQVQTGTQRHYPRYHLYCLHFGATTEEDSASRKARFLSEEMDWVVENNEPLTKLISDLRDLAYYQNPGRGDPEFLTYKSMLTAFNQALASQGWPVNDAALPFTLPRDSTSSQSKGKKRAREDDDMDNKDQAGDEGDSAGPSTPRRAPKRPLVGPSPIRNELEADLL